MRKEKLEFKDINLKEKNYLISPSKKLNKKKML